MFIKINNKKELLDFNSMKGRKGGIISCLFDVT